MRCVLYSGGSAVNYYKPFLGKGPVISPPHTCLPTGTWLCPGIDGIETATYWSSPSKIWPPRTIWRRGGRIHTPSCLRHTPTLGAVTPTDPEREQSITWGHRQHRHMHSPLWCHFKGHSNKGCRRGYVLFFAASRTHITQCSGLTHGLYTLY